MRTLAFDRNPIGYVFLDELVWFKMARPEQVLDMKSPAFAVDGDDCDYIGHPFNLSVGDKGLALPKLVDRCEYEVIQDCWGTPHLVVVKK